MNDLNGGPDTVLWELACCSYDNQENTSYCWGVIAPARGDETGEPEGLAEPLLPPEVVTLGNVLSIQDYTVEGVEEDYGKPVFTNGNTRAWRLIHDGIAPPVYGWGRLLTTP